MAILFHRNLRLVLTAMLCLGLAGAGFAGIDFREIAGPEQAPSRALCAPSVVGVIAATRLSRIPASGVAQAKHWVAGSIPGAMPGLADLEWLAAEEDATVSGAQPPAKRGRSPPLFSLFE